MEIFYLAIAEESHLLIDLGFAVAAAFLGGLLAQRLGQPLLVGYLLAGILIGPYTPGPISDVTTVQTLAEIGVALLLFSLGTEFSFSQLLQVGRAAILGGLAQIVLTIGLGTALGTVLGYALVPSIFLGAIIALSSSVVIIKVMMGRGEMDSLPAKLAIGVAIVQDLSLVPLMVILPALADTGREPLTLLIDIGGALLTSTVFLVLVYVIGTWLVPRLLARVAVTAGRELFLITVSITALGTALLAQAVGISLAIGAFLGGLLVAQSELAHHALEEIRPLRDIFSAVFFVSVGMLINPLFVLGNLPLVALMVVVILAGKFIITSGLFALFRYPLAIAVPAGLVLTQIGEFSFVLADLGVNRGIITRELQALILASALATIIATPLLMAQSERIAAFLGRLPGLRRLEAPEQGALAPVPAPQRERGSRSAQPTLDPLSGDLPPLKNHVVVCGYGRVGSELADAVRRQGFTVVAIDLDRFAVQRAAQVGIPCLYGDAAEPQVLEHAGVGAARVLAVTLPDLADTERILRWARAHSRRLTIITRADDLAGVPVLQAAGATEVVQPEVEAGLEFVRRTMRKMGLAQVEIHSLLAQRRGRSYELLGRREHGPDHDRDRLIFEEND
jgi:CPA2 family monovalent cation:H+ antiporter-2